MTRPSLRPALTALAACALSATVPAQKPILPDFHADPSAHEWDGRFWIYPSHDLPGSRDWDMVDWHAFSSTDLVTWTDHGVIFCLKDIPWAKKWAWAPDAMQRNGKYYFYVTADDQIGVAVADRPEGPFRDALGKPLIARGESGTRVMDPAVFVDDDGQAYLYFGQNEARAVKLKDDMIARDGPIADVPLTNFHEGIWMHKRNGMYLPLVLCDGDERRRAAQPARLLDLELAARPVHLPRRLHGQQVAQRPPLDRGLRRAGVPLLPRAGAELVRAAGRGRVPRDTTPTGRSSAST